MSELKAFNCVESDLQEFCEPRLVYLKSEADKVIVDLEESHKKEVEQLLIEIVKLKDVDSKNRSAYYKDLAMMAKDVEHQKYKRCLAMAMWCFTKSNYHYILARHGEDSKKNNRKSILYSRWNKRWFKIAAKFNEEN